MAVADLLTMVEQIYPEDPPLNLRILVFQIKTLVAVATGLVSSSLKTVVS